MAVSERAAGCLQALTAGCEENHAALLGINNALPALVRCLGPGASTARPPRCLSLCAPPLRKICVLDQSMIFA